jgi:hypothetical protein
LCEKASGAGRSVSGPAISLQTSEPLFDVAVALNECGYDQDLENSDPLRQHVRDEVNQYLQGSAEARDARDKVCNYIASIGWRTRGATWRSMFRWRCTLTPPPELAPSVELHRDAAGLDAGGRDSAAAARFCAGDRSACDLGGEPRAYEDEVAKLHDPLTKMILATNVYLKMPAERL